MKKILLLLSLFAVASCQMGIKDGDLVFVRAALESEFSRAIDAATGSEDEASFDHVGIVMVREREVWVVEAAPSSGVICRRFAAFAAENGEENLVIVRPRFGPCTKFDRKQVVSRALGFVGRPYDFYFMPGDEALYCSELVYEAYVDVCGEYIFDTVPMNFRAADGSMPEYWALHFAAVGMEVPEGVQGTNPNQIFNLLINDGFSNKLSVKSL